LIKLSSRGWGENYSVKLTNSWNQAETTQTYTMTSSCSKVSINVSYWGKSSPSRDGIYSVAFSIKRWSTTVWSFSQGTSYWGDLSWADFVILSDVQAWEVITLTCNASWEYYGSYASWWAEYSLVGQSWGNIERNLIPTEIVEIWKQACPTTYGRLPNWKRYGEITWDTTTVQTWNISLGNAVGFITMEYNWYVLKIPYYN